MKIKTKELIGIPLDWAVAQADSHRVEKQAGHLYLVTYDKPTRRIAHWQPSTAWAQGGPILDREGIDVLKDGDHWTALKTMTAKHPHLRVAGPTALVAITRCYVMAEMGDEVDVPEELLP